MCLYFFIFYYLKQNYILCPQLNVYNLKIQFIKHIYIKADKKKFILD